MTDAIVARIMRIRNGMTTDEDAKAIIEREIAALQPHERSSPDIEPVIKSFSTSVKDTRCLEVWFANPVDTETRAWLLDSINEKAARASQPATPTGGKRRPDAYLHQCRDAVIEPTLSFEPARNPQWTSKPLYLATPSPMAQQDEGETPEGVAAEVAYFEEHADRFAGAHKDIAARCSAAIASVWTPQQFWEYVEGLTDSLVRDQIRDMLASTGLTITNVAQPSSYRSDVEIALREIRRYCDENLGPSRSSLLSKIANIADAALAMTSTERQ